MKKRYGILGGTFDPIHYGHLLIAEHAADQFALDEVAFIPTGHSPHKDDTSITPANIRCDMVRLAIQDNPRFSLSLLEIDSDEVNYTYRTLEKLKAEDANRELFFIMGGDSLSQFETWRFPERIVKAATLLVAIRQDCHADDREIFNRELLQTTQRYGGKFEQLDTPNVELSSHQIRQQVMQKKSVRYMLPDAVLAYIKEHKLYGFE